MLTRNEKGRTLRVRLKGGMGNQLFQLASLTAVAIKENMELHLLPPSGSRGHALSWLGIDANCTYIPEINKGQLTYRMTSNKRRFLLEKYDELDFAYREIPSFNKSIRVDGYFQSFKYFDTIFTEFVSWIRLTSLISKSDAESNVLLHVRLGDFARNPEFRDFHGVLDSNYYIEAIQEFSLKNPKVTVVTDDPVLFQVEHKILLDTFPQIEIVSKSPTEDFNLLAAASNLVIGNSTFSWWAAATSEAEVIAPSSWFKAESINFVPQDFYLPGWKLL